MNVSIRDGEAELTLKEGEVLGIVDRSREKAKMLFDQMIRNCRSQEPEIWRLGKQVEMNELDPLEVVSWVWRMTVAYR